MSPAVDMHCHLDLYPEPVSAVRRCRELGAYVLSVTTTPKAWRGTLAISKSVPRIRTSLGFHPQIAHERIGELPLFEGLLPETRYVGEVGLDGSPECKPHWREQVKVFDQVLKFAAAAGGRIFSVHSRRAASDVLDMFDRHPNAGVHVLHWFTGSKAELERAVGMGCWFSVGPAMLASKRGQDLVALMPRDRVLTETDGPFATVNRVLLQPANVGRAVRGLAVAWGIEEAEVSQNVLGAFRRLAASKTGGPKAKLDFGQSWAC